MIAIAGVVVVILAVIGGYLLERGPLAVLLQPSELLIIGGSMIDTILVSRRSRCSER